MADSTLVATLGMNEVDEVMTEALSDNSMHSLSPGLLEEALKPIGVNYMRDQDGDLCTFIQGDSHSCHAMCWFLIDDQYPQIFTLYCRVFPRIPKSKWQAALFACNAYNKRFRFGRFKLSITPEEEEATLCFDSHLHLSDGTTAAFLKTFILTHLTSACAFLGDSQVHKQLFLAPLKRSTKTTPTEVAHTS
jgi:hypothetical protein